MNSLAILQKRIETCIKVGLIRNEHLLEIGAITYINYNEDNAYFIENTCSKVLKERQSFFSLHLYYNCFYPDAVIIRL